MTVAEFITQLMSASTYPVKQINLTSSLLEAVPYEGEGGGYGSFEYRRKLGRSYYKKICFALMISECRDLEAIILRDQALHRLDLQSLAVIVKRNVNLRILNLDDNTLAWPYAVEIFESIAVSVSLEELSIRRCGLTDAALSKLSETLITNKTLQRVYLGRSSHQFSLDAFENFVKSLEKNTTLLECDIDIWTLNLKRRERIKKQLASILERNRQHVQNFVLSKSSASSVSASTSTSTSSTSPAFFKNVESTSISTSIAAKEVIDKEFNIAITWEKDLFAYIRSHQLSYTNAKLINYIIVALSSLSNFNPTEVLDALTKASVPEDLICLLSQFIKRNPLSIERYSFIIKECRKNLLVILPEAQYVEDEIMRLLNSLGSDLISRGYSYMPSWQLFQQTHNLPSLTKDNVAHWVVAALRDFSKGDRWMNQSVNHLEFVDIRHSFRFIKDQELLYAITKDPVRLKVVCDNLLNPSLANSPPILIKADPVFNALLTTTARSWVNSLEKVGCTAREAVTYVSAALRVLRDNRYSKILNKSDDDIPERITRKLNRFVEKNPVLLEAGEHPRLIKQICDDLLREVDESGMESADSSYSSSRSFN